MNEHNCAFCKSSEIALRDTLPPNEEWEKYLREERDFLTFSYVRVPVCYDCRSRWHDLRDASGYGSASVDEAKELLNDIDIDQLIRFNDMGEEMEDV